MTISVEKNVRSFIAIPVPSQEIEALEQAVKGLDEEIGRQVRWVRSAVSYTHLTLPTKA